MEKVILVAIGGAAGAVLRFLAGQAVGRWAGEAALGTLFVNVTGSFLMGLCALLILERMPEMADRLGPLVLVGLLGGFTTFSAFSLDILRFYEAGRIAYGIGYGVGSFALSIAGLAAGLMVARWVST